MPGVKETKEVIRAVIISGAFIGERLKDGPDLGDLFAIPAWIVRNQADLRAGFDQIKDVPAEMKDLTAEEREELAVFFLEEMIPIILTALKQ